MPSPSKKRKPNPKSTPHKGKTIIDFFSKKPSTSTTSSSTAALEASEPIDDEAYARNLAKLWGEEDRNGVTSRPKDPKDLEDPETKDIDNNSENNSRQSSDANRLTSSGSRAQELATRLPQLNGEKAENRSTEASEASGSAEYTTKRTNSIEEEDIELAIRLSQQEDDVETGQKKAEASVGTITGASKTEPLGSSQGGSQGSAIGKRKRSLRIPGSPRSQSPGEPDPSLSTRPSDPQPSTPADPKPNPTSPSPSQTRQPNSTAPLAPPESLDTLPLDTDPLSFTPSSYEYLTKSWPNNKAPYALLTHAFVLINSTRSRIKIVDTLVNLFRLLIHLDPESLVSAVCLHFHSFPFFSSSTLMIMNPCEPPARSPSPGKALP
jgi:hypothetical protein